MDVDHASLVVVDECTGKEPHEARKDDQSRFVLVDAGAQGRLKVCPSRERPVVNDMGGEFSPSSALQGERLGIIGDDRGNGNGQVLLRGIDDRLQVAPTSGDQDHDGGARLWWHGVSRNGLKRR